MYRMHGPFRLERLYETVNPGQMGVYVLSSDGQRPDYVGRSDSDLVDRIRRSSQARNDYRFFWFWYATSLRDSYRFECELIHTLDPRDNTYHPAVPPGANYRCPVGGCDWA